MIQILSWVTIVWIYGILVFGLLLGILVRRLSPLDRFKIRRNSYVWLCVAWPFTLIAIAEMMIGQVRRNRVK